MAFPTAHSNPSMVDVWKVVQHRTATTRLLCVEIVNYAGTGKINAKTLLDMGTHLEECLAIFEKAADTNLYPDMQAFARTQINEPGYNVVQGFVDMRNAFSNFRDWLLANYPTSGGYLSTMEWAGPGDARWKWADITLAPAAATALTNQANLVIAQLRAPVS